jgi:PAS domain S-box-containing protein
MTMKNEYSERIALLERKLDRESRARAEAEQLLESKASELNFHVQQLMTEVNRTRVLSAAMESATDGIALADQDGLFTFMNKAHASMFGYAIDELVGQPWSVLYEQDEIERIGNDVMPKLFQDLSWRGEATGKTRSGQTILQEIVLTAMPDGSLICSTRDITARRLAQVAARKTEFKLQQAERQAALYALGNAVAHDFNNLIAAISGYATLIEQDVLAGSDNSIRAQRIQQAANQASAVVRSLEIDRQDDTISMAEVDLVSLVKTGLSIAEAIRPPGIKIQVDLPETAIAHANELAISRGLLNVAKNAFDAMGENGTLAIRLSRIPREMFFEPEVYKCIGKPAHEYQWVVEISDTGPGIGIEKLDKIFDPFFSTKPSLKGSGLGLMSLTGLVETGSAFVEVSSEPGRGTQFRISLHRRAITAGESSSIANRVSHATLGEMPHILVVEDDPMMGDVLKATLSSFGFRPHWIDNPTTALSYIANLDHEIDLLLTDQTMPGMQGSELTELAKHLRPDLPVIIYSGQAKYITPDPAYFAILRKPIEASELETCIGAALASRQVQ